MSKWSRYMADKQASRQQAQRSEDADYLVTLLVIGVVGIACFVDLIATAIR